MRSLLIAISALLVLAAPAHAASYRVTGGADPATGPGTCTPVGDGIFDCPTLRAAVLAANDANGSDSIVLPAGVYDVGQGELPVTGQVSISGADTRTTTIRRVGTTDLRLFNFSAGSGGSLITFLTLTGGRAGIANGGNVLTAVDLSLAYVHVTAGNAGNGGGGVAVTGPATLQIYSSLLDGNTAGTGGAIAALNADLAVVNSTITANSGEAVAAVEFSGTAENTATLTMTTVARNGQRALEHDGAGTFELRGTIVADNDTNCVGTFTDAGGNLEDKNECGLGAGSVHDQDPGLAGAVANLGGFTDVLAIPATSPAVDIVPQCIVGIDQRDVARVSTLLQACDAGAYEATPNSGAISQPPPAEITSGAVSGGSATFTFAAPRDDLTYECSLNGPGQSGAFAPCTSPKTYSGLAPGSYLFSVRSVAGGTTSNAVAFRTFDVAGTAQQTPTPTPTPAPSPTPVPQKDATGKVVSGKVLIKVGGKFAPFDPSKAIPTGAEIDVTKGRIELTAILKPGGKPETATFYDGIFKLTLGKTTTDLALSQPLAKCPKKAADAAAKKPKTRKLWGSGSGSFRTRGQYSAATVRGTTWLVQDSCAGTLTRVTKGVVSVFDNVKKKTILLKAGKSYLAKPRR